MDSDAIEARKAAQAEAAQSPKRLLKTRPIIEALSEGQQVELANIVEPFISPEPTSGCHLWIGKISQKGYGIVSFNGHPYLAHRVLYELNVEAIPYGLTVEHKCRTRCCVNPDHFLILTIRENVMRSPIYNGAKERCKHGHPFEGRNLIFKRQHNAFGMRQCRECRRLQKRDARRRNRTKNPGATRGGDAGA